MALIDVIEKWGAAVSRGETDRATAVQHIMEYSDGGLTRLGAEDMLRRWRTARAEYQAVFDRSAAALIEIRKQMEGEST